jgi:hypothetical protein
MRSSKMRRAIILITIALIGAAFPVLPSQAAPSIEFLNPSTYSGPTMRISAKEDANGDTSYHLVAWAGEVPSNPLVEFEVRATPPIPGGEDGPALATVTATRVGTDTFEGELSTSTLTDGQYFLTAILYSGFLGPGTGTEVARDEEAVTIQSSGPTAANTVELAYPGNGAPVGFWKTSAISGVAVVTGFASAGTNQVRALYSTSAPGSEPAWTACGSGSVSDRQFRVRCTLAEGANPLSVRAIAAVANRQPPPTPPQPSGDETGDAHRVVPYLQNPTSITMSPASSQTNQSKCTIITLTAKDQSGVVVAALNVDIHAQGPDDQLRFATDQVNGINTHSAFQPPDAAHTANEPVTRCGATDPEGRQGEHSVPGGDDVKHIESTPTGGTNNLGQFVFILHSATKGGTQISAWGDELDDDNLNASSEASGTAQLGWGEAAPPAATSLSLDPSSATGNVGGCERIVATATQNGTAQAGRNVDVHIKDPSGVAFCNPGDSTVTPPDSGGHTGDADGTENTHHAEGTTNSSGDIIFGVTSPNTGETSVVVWVDDNNSDTQDSSESTTAGTIEWLREGGRTITIQSSKKTVSKGSKVTLSGRISGSDACSNQQGVKIQAKKLNGGRFHTVAKTSTNGDGEYDVRKRVKSSKKFRALAPKAGPCSKARSKAITVRTKG